MLGTIVGWPLPNTFPDVAMLQWRLTNGQVPDVFWINTCAIVLWIAWAQLTVGTVAELAAVTRGRTTRLPRGFAWAQQTVARLVVTATLLTALAQQPAYATVTLGALTTQTHNASAITSTPDRVVVTLAPTIRSDERVASQHWVVKRLDSLWGIAETVLGDGNRWPEIRDRNIGRTMPDGTVLQAGFTAVRPGWTLDIAGTTPARADTTVVGSIHTVAPGESFWQIAEATLAETLGHTPSIDETGTYWRRLVDTNLDRLAPPHDPSVIHPGDQFVLPIVSDVAPKVAPTPAPRPLTPVQPTTVTTPAAAATPTNASPQPTTPHSSAATAEPGVDDERSLTLALAGCGILAGGIALRVRTLRRRQLRRRHPHTSLPPITETEAETSDVVRSIAATDATVWLDATLRYHAAQLAETENARVVLVARAGTHGVEFLLKEPADPPTGFGADPTRRAWRLDPTLELADLKRVVGDAIPYTPALASIGAADGHELLVDLEAVDVMAVEGDPADTEAFLRGLSIGVSNTPWGRHVDLIDIDIDTPGDRAHTPADPEAWATTVIGLFLSEVGVGESAGDEEQPGSTRTPYDLPS